MKIKSDFFQILKLTGFPVNSEEYPSAKRLEEYKNISDRLCYVILGMIIGSHYTGKQIRKILSEVKKEGKK